MTNTTTNSQAPEILAKQVAEWLKEVARLNDLIAHAEGRDSQAASIDTPEFDDLLLTYWECRNHGESYATNERAELIAYIDAKLAQAKLRGMELANEKVFQPDMDEWKARAEAMEAARDDAVSAEYAAIARATAAESRLAEIQRGVEGAEGYWRNAPHYYEVGSLEPQKEFFLADDIRALLQPHGQADTSGLPG